MKNDEKSTEIMKYTIMKNTKMQTQTHAHAHNTSIRTQQITQYITQKIQYYCYSIVNIIAIIYYNKI